MEFGKGNWWAIDPLLKPELTQAYKRLGNVNGALATENVTPPSSPLFHTPPTSPLDSLYNVHYTLFYVSEFGKGNWWAIDPLLKPELTQAYKRLGNVNGALVYNMPQNDNNQISPLFLQHNSQFLRELI
eukprot:sb/3475230/